MRINGCDHDIVVVALKRGKHIEFLRDRVTALAQQSLFSQANVVPLLCVDLRPILLLVGGCLFFEMDDFFLFFFAAAKRFDFEVYRR